MLASATQAILLHLALTPSLTLTKVRGVESAGMMCGVGELGLLGPGEVAPKEVVVHLPYS